MSRFWRKVALVGLDLVASLAAMALAFLIRFDGQYRPEFVAVWLQVLPAIIPLRLVMYYLFGLYRQVWSHASVPELLRLFWAVTAESAISAAIIYSLPHPFPRSVLIIGWFVKLGLLGSLRLALRLRREWHILRKSTQGHGTKTLIFGAGDAGAMLARDFAKHPELGCTVLGFVDDDPHKLGYHVAGKPILGSRHDLPELVRKYGVNQLIIAVPSARGKVVREIVEMARPLGLPVKTLPGLMELVNGTASPFQVRDVQIEDLLGREEIRVDLERVAAYLTGEVVLVTGAGGSIGSELSRQVARLGPSRLILLGHGENSIYEIDQELRQSHPGLDLIPVIADIQDGDRIRKVFERFRPGVVFHSAAHKHVPLMEHNPEEAIKNNVFGTYNVAEAAHLTGVKRFVLISSDKAVNPASVMGATKRAAELIIQSYSQRSGTVFVAVRFGNVLGSRGSIIPLFRKQIAAGGPVTVTDPRMVRYFMTIPEAVHLVIQAAALGLGGEVFVLDMGEPVRIVDLARELIRLSGMEPDVDIQIVYTGMRAGEKLFEELLTAEEGTVATQHERIFKAKSDAVSEPVLQEMLQRMRQLSSAGETDRDQILELVAKVTQAPPVRVGLPDAVASGN